MDPFNKIQNHILIIRVSLLFIAIFTCWGLKPLWGRNDRATRVERDSPPPKPVYIPTTLQGIRLNDYPATVQKNFQGGKKIQLYYPMKQVWSIWAGGDENYLYLQVHFYKNQAYKIERFQMVKDVEADRAFATQESSTGPGGMNGSWYVWSQGSGKQVLKMKILPSDETGKKWVQTVLLDLTKAELARSVESGEWSLNRIRSVLGEKPVIKPGETGETVSPEEARRRYEEWKAKNKN